MPTAVRTRRRTRGARTAALGALALLLASCLDAAAQPAPEAASSPPVIELFGREGCPHCAAAQRYLDALTRARPELRVHHFDVVEDPKALARLQTLTAEAGLVQAAVPAVYVRGRLFIGFDGPTTTGAAIEAWLDQRSTDLAFVPSGSTCAPSSAVPCAPTPAPEAHAMRVPLLGELDVRSLGLPLFTLAVGLIDGFNPCAMWVLLFVLSMLVNLHDRARMALVGGTFVLVSGVVYFAFMAAWLNFFLLVGISRTVQIALGVIAIAIGSVHVKDFFAFGKGISLSIPDAAKPGIYRRVRQVLSAEHLGAALGAVVVLATMVNVVELLCTAGLPALYTQVLTAQHLPMSGYYAYLALYNIAYMLDDSIMLGIAVVTLSQRKLQERGGRVLKLVSGLVMAALGLMLVFAPRWLSWG